MKKIFVVGGLTSGSGGMESAFKKLYTLLSDEFDVEFLILGKRHSKVDIHWMKNIKAKIYGHKLFFRALSKKYFSYRLKKRLIKDKPHIIIAYDAFGCAISKQVTEYLNIDCKVISWIHFSFDAFSEKNKKRIMLADFHFAICDELKTQMINAGIERNTIFTIYNPTKPQYETILRPNDKMSFLYVGRIQYGDQKNLQYMFKGLSNFLYDFTLNIVGDGSTKDITELKLLAKELNIDSKIIWHGWKKNAWNYVITNINGVSALLMSSTYEGFPMTLGEAISYGVFCISSDCKTGPNEIITVKNGLLYDLNSPSDFVEKLNLFHDMVLPSPEVIKSSIHYLYDENYIYNIKRIFHEILD